MGRLRHLFVGIGLFSSVFLTGSTVAFYEEALPTTMNPLFARSMPDFRAHELVFDRLFFRGSIANELQSNLVETFQSLEGGTKLQLNLKKGIKWHDGKPLTAKDVCFTVDAMLNPKTPSPIAKPYKEAIADCSFEKSKPETAIITFNKVFHNPRERVAFSIVPAVSKSSTIRAGTELSNTPDSESRCMLSAAKEPTKASCLRRNSSRNSNTKIAGRRWTCFKC